jgi:4-carboxymuconolactone decarboxylase
MRRSRRLRDAIRAALFVASLTVDVPSIAQVESMQATEPTVQFPDAAAVADVSPALEHYARTSVDDLWNRPGLSKRDRSLVTLAAVVARNQPVELEPQLERALDNGVLPAEISELVTHLAFYSGWGNAMTAVPVVRRVFERRGVGRDALPRVAVQPLPMDAEAEAKRAASVHESTGPVSPGLERFTTDLLFHDLWLRPGLAARDRSLVTVSALVTAGRVEQIPFHLNKAMDNGLTAAEVGEVIAQLAFYAGWPQAFTAVPVVKGVLEKRAQ